MTTLDALVFFSYVLLVLLIGFLAGRTKQRDTEDFFLAGKKLPWYLIGTSIICASISSEQLLGEVGFAYLYGLAVANWEWSIVPALTLMAFIFVPLFYRTRLATIPQFLEKRFGSTTRLAFAIVTVVSYVFINLAGVTYSGGYLIEKVFGFNRFGAMAGLITLAGIYSVYGGLASMARVDLFQGALMLTGGLVILALGWQAIPDPWQALFEAGERSHLILPASHPDLPWTAMLVLVISTNVWYYCTNQFIVQKTLAARSEFDARMGVIFTGFLGVLLALSVTFPGLIAYALNPDLIEFDEAYPYVISTLVPVGLRGLILASVCGAIVSTIASIQNSSVTLLSIDLFPRVLKGQRSQKDEIRLARISGVIILIAGGMWAPAVMLFPGIFSFFQDCWALFAAPIAVVFLAGVFWKRANEAGALVTLSLCIPAVGLVYLLRHVEAEVNILSLGGIAFLIAWITMITASHSWRGTEVVTLSWNIRELTKAVSNAPIHDPARRPRWFGRPLFWWTILVLVYTVIYYSFW